MRVLHVCAQQPAMLHYTVDEGLPSNEVYDLYEDSLGFIWAATDHGISRFDGYSFRNYSTSDGLVHNTIFGFYEDAHKRVWMRSFNSALCYLDGDSIKPYMHNASLQKFLGRNFIQNFAFDKAGNLWFVCIRREMGLYRQDAKTGNIEKTDLPDGFNAFIRELDSGEIIAGIDRDNGYAPPAEFTADNEVQYTDHTWLFRVPDLLEQSRSLVHCAARADGFAFTYDSHVVVLQGGRITFRHTFSELIRDCYVDAHGQTWLSADGFYRLTGSGVEPSVILNGTDGAGMLNDGMNNYWFCSLSNGIYLARNMQITTLQETGGKSLGELLSLCAYRNALIMLSKQGVVYSYAFSSAGFNDPTISSWSLTFPGANTMFYDTLTSRFFINHFMYRIASGNFETSRLLNNNLDGPAARDYCSRNDSIFIAGNNGWHIITSEGKTCYRSLEHGYNGFCTAINITTPGRIWIGSSDGLYYFSNGQTLPYEPGNPLFRQRVTDIATDANGRVYISTRGGGIILIDGTKIHTIRTTDGLSSDQCGKMCIDSDVVWVCTNNGLNRVTMAASDTGAALHVDQLNMQQGLPSVMINDVLCIGNVIYLATGKGLAWFDKTTYEVNKKTPAVYIRSFLSNNREFDADALTPEDHNISIGYIALLFRNEGVINYRYKLDGYELEWNYTTERMARYFNLPPGDYTFSVSAMNENGFWNEHPASIHFTIPPHFTETLWFRIAIGAATALLVLTVFMYILGQQKKRQRISLALSQAEQKALRAQMKPHFIFNALNSIQNFMLTNDEESANVYLTSFAQLMRRILDHSRHSVISLQEELDTMGIYLELEKLRFGNSFHFQIHVEPGIQPETLLIPSLFIQPYIENAIWHGLQMQKNNPSLEIRFSLEGNYLLGIIEDNGIGRKRSEALNRTRNHRSAGMQNVKERINLLNVGSRDKISVEIIDLHDEAGSASGTRVELRFPVNRKELF